MIKGIEEAIKKISEYNPDEDYVQACEIIKSFVTDAKKSIEYLEDMDDIKDKFYSSIEQENTVLRNGLKVLKRSISLKPASYYYTSYEIYNDILDFAYIKEMMEVLDNE